jgi:hypothetical protein
MYEDEKRQRGEFGGLWMWVVEHTDCWIGVSGGGDLERLVGRVLAEESRIGGQSIWQWSWSAKDNGSEMERNGTTGTRIGRMGELGEMPQLPLPRLSETDATSLADFFFFFRSP